MNSDCGGRLGERQFGRGDESSVQRCCRGEYLLELQLKALSIG